MVKVTKSVMIEIEKDGKRITLDQNEFDDIKRQLETWREIGTMKSNISGFCIFYRARRSKI